MDIPIKEKDRTFQLRASEKTITLLLQPIIKLLKKNRTIVSNESFHKRANIVSGNEGERER